MIGEVVQAEEVPRAPAQRRHACPGGRPRIHDRRAAPSWGNRSELYGSDFSWVVGEWLRDIKRPEALMVLERRRWGNFYGYLLAGVKENGQVVAEGDAAVGGELQKRMQRVDDLYAKLYKLEKGDIGGINHGLERLRLKERKLQLDGKVDAAARADLAAERSELQALQGPGRAAQRPAPGVQPRQRGNARRQRPRAKSPLASWCMPTSPTPWAWAPR